MNPSACSRALRPELVERVLLKLGFADHPTGDLVGLNAVHAAWSERIAFDNVQKRIWLSGDRSCAPPGADPNEFFENWLRDGTGGTCWPAAEGTYALLRSLGFNARRVAGSMIESGDHSPRPDHGSVIAVVEGRDYLVDASMLAFEVLPLVAGVPARAGPGIHTIQALPVGDGFDVLWHPGHMRDAPASLRLPRSCDPVEYTFFLDGYRRSTTTGPFNHALYLCRRYRDAIVTLGRKNRIDVDAGGRVTVTRINNAERKRVLIEELGLSEQIVDRLPPDTRMESNRSTPSASRGAR